MNQQSGFDIDFSEAEIIQASAFAYPPSRAHPRLDKLWGFHAPGGRHKLSGPCAIATLLHAHEIGWHHLPRTRNGRPLNTPFVEEVMRWSGTPDLISGSMGTTPMAILKGLRKAGLNCHWYAGNSLEASLGLIRQELHEDRPVVALTSHAAQGDPLMMEWKVICKIDGEAVHTKQFTKQLEKRWEQAEEHDLTHEAITLESFKAGFELPLAALSCSLITAKKD